MKKVFTLLLLILLPFGTLLPQWIIQHSSNPTQSCYAIKFYDNNTGYYSGVLYNSSTMNIYKTTNGGVNFTAQNSNYTAQRFMSIFIIHPDTVFISGNYGKILRTYNGGQNWVPFVYSDTTRQFWGLWFVNSLTGFCAGSHGTVLKTTNRGDNWTLLATGQITLLDGIYFLNEMTGFITGANKIIKTTDQGSTWTEKTGIWISPFETAEDVYFKDANTGMYSTNAGKIARTTNGGDTWTYVYEQTGGGAVWGIEFPDPDIGYGCTSTGKVVKTTNGGVNWGEQNTPLSENLYEISFPSVQTGYICSWSGKILKTTNGGLTFAGKLGTEVPDKYSLSQNFPNPFNPVTAIKFDLPEAGEVSLKVFDISGKEVQTLVKERLQTGSYEITFDGSGLTSGVYFYRISANGFVSTKKMMMVK